MAKQIIYQNGVILQWQDTDKFNYGAPAQGVGVLPVTDDQWAQKDALKWVRNGALTDVAPPAPAPEPPALITRFSSLEYLSRFTDAEYQAVRSGPMALQRGLDSLIAAQYVDLNDLRTAQYLSAMVTAGIIDEVRRAELLTPQAA